MILRCILVLDHAYAFRSENIKQFRKKKGNMTNKVYNQNDQSPVWSEFTERNQSVFSSSKFLTSVWTSKLGQSEGLSAVAIHLKFMINLAFLTLITYHN